HGLHVSPRSPADNVLITIVPKGSPATNKPLTFVGSYDYRYEIPADHLPGTHWYHAHLHGSTSIQLASGMAGILIVEGDIDEVPEIRAATERTFLFQQIPYEMIEGGPGVVEDRSLDNLVARFNGELSSGDRKRFTTINGIVPVVRMKQGSVERWRLVHGGIFELLPIDIVGCERPYDPASRSIRDYCDDPENAAATDGVVFYPIARDGITLGTLTEVKAAQLPVLGPGNRMDILVKALRPGTYILRKGPEQLLFALNASVRFSDLAGPGAPAESAASSVVDEPYTLAVIVVEAHEQDMPLPGEAAMAALRRPAILDAAAAPEPRHVIRLERRGPSGFVNGRTFVDGQFPRTLVLGDVERWSIEAIGELHPFHKHVNPFLLIEQNGEPLDPPVWLDTISVPSGEQATLVTRYDTFVGKFVLHCHNLVHEDLGMMELVEIVPRPGGAIAGLTYFQFDTAPARSWSFAGANGRTLTVADFDARVVLIAPWSPDCPSCVQELSRLAALQATLANQPLSVAAVMVGADVAAAERYLQANGLAALTAYADPGSALKAHFAVDSFPAAILIDRAGHARAALKGSGGWDAADAAALVRYFCES
ncbi:MAG: multicopper oxidase domain-containing protein, partial [Actinomycetota bacterium]